MDAAGAGVALGCDYELIAHLSYLLLFPGVQLPLIDARTRDHG